MQTNKEASNILIFVILAALLLVAGLMLSGRDDSDEVIEEEETTLTEEREVGTVGEGNEPIASDGLTVSYTSQGFSPFILEVNAGDTVNFVNNSNGTMWVTSEAHPTADQHYPEFGMSKSIGPGEVYVFQFTLTGSWGYKNLNNEKHLGAIVVIPQER